MKEQTSVEEDKTVRLMLGYLCIANEAEASLVRKVEILDRFEFPGTEIAQICGCALQAVHDARRRRKKRVNARKK